MFVHGETVTVLTAGEVVDPYSGDSVEDWDSPTEVIVNRVAVAMGGSLGSSEPLQDARNQVESDFDLLFPPSATVTAQDRVVVRGLTCEVVGRPFLWRNPFTGWTPGLVVQAKLREG
jgi:hypothetical protein